MCHTLWWVRITPCLQQGPFPAPYTRRQPWARSSPTTPAIFYSHAEEEKGNMREKQKQFGYEITSPDRALQSPCRPTDQTQIKWPKIRDKFNFTMWGLQFVKDIASVRQTSQLHAEGQAHWLDDRFSSCGGSLLLCDHPPQVNGSSLLLAQQRGKKIQCSLPKVSLLSFLPLVRLFNKPWWLCNPAHAVS